MRIALKCSISGLRDGELWPEVGVPFDVAGGEGENLIAAGIAEFVGKEPDVEVADAVPPGEQAVAPPAKPRSRKAAKG